MDTRRKACYLLLILLFDAFNFGSQQTPPWKRPILDKTTSNDSYSTVKNENHEDRTNTYNVGRPRRATADTGENEVILEISQYILKNSEDLQEAYAILEQIDHIMSDSLLTSKQYFIQITKSALIESGLATFESKPSVNCKDLKDETARMTHQAMPLASEMNDFSLLLIFVTLDCHNESLDILTELESKLGSLEEVLNVLLDFIDSLVGTQDNGTPVNTELREELMATSSTEDPATSSVKLLINEGHTLEVFMHETATDPKICKWNLLSTEVCYERQELLETLLEAQLMCERLHGECYGVIGNETFTLVDRCIGESKLPNIGYNGVLFWKKDCQLVPTKLSGSIQKREASVGTVTLYEHSYYKGKQKTFTPEDFLVDYVGTELNDKTSSLSCQPTPCTVIAFQHSQFKGFQISYESEANYVGKNYNDRFSSFIFLPYSLSVLCIQTFSQPNFRGFLKKVCGDTIFSSVVRVRSLKLSCETCSVIVYKDVYKGSFMAFTADVPQISEEWIEIKSVQMRPWDYGQYMGHIQWPVTFYEHSYFKGQSQELQGKVDYVGRRLNDKYSSFSCFGKCNVLLFEHSAFGGAAVLYQGSQQYMKAFNDKTSSVVIIPYEICVTVYQHSSFRGRSVRVCSDVFDMSTIGMNDQISSLSVECGHCSVIVYQHSQNEGRYKSFRGQVNYVGNSWNDIISSIQIRPWEVSSEGCVADAKEQKAYNVIQYIPVVSFFYSLFSSVVYGAKGCSSVAKERAKNMAIDLALDVAIAAVTVVSGGTATAGVYAAKTAVKQGIKAGVKAFGRAAVTLTKNGIKNVAKNGVKGISKDALKSTVTAIKSVKNIPGNVVKTVKNLPSNVGKLGKNVVSGVKEVKTTGVQTSFNKFKKAVKQKIDNAYDKAVSKIDNVNTGKVKTICKRTPVCDLAKIKKEWIADYNNLHANLKSRITESEYLSLRAFTAVGERSGGISTKMNHYLRKTERAKTLSPDDITTINHHVANLDQFLQRQPKYTSQLTRYEKVLPGLNDYRLNTEFPSPTFLSTSKRPDFKVTDIIGTVGKGNDYYKLTIQPKSAVDVHQFLPSGKANYDLLEEALFPRNIKFKVIRMGNPKSVTYRVSNKKYTVRETDLLVEEIIPP